MGIEYLRLTSVYNDVSMTMSEFPTTAWWAMGIGLLFCVWWTVKR